MKVSIDSNRILNVMDSRFLRSEEAEFVFYFLIVAKRLSKIFYPRLRSQSRPSSSRLFVNLTPERIFHCEIVVNIVAYPVCILNLKIVQISKIRRSELR